MPTTVTKERQTSTSLTTAYGMIIRSMNSRTFPSPSAPSPDSLGSSISYSRPMFCDFTYRLERSIADWILPLDSIRQMFLSHIKCLTGPSRYSQLLQRGQLLIIIGT